MYFAVVLDDLWVNCKNACAVGAMSKYDWNIIEEKYHYHADDVYDRETKSYK